MLLVLLPLHSAGVLVTVPHVQATLGVFSTDPGPQWIVTTGHRLVGWTFRTCPPRSSWLCPCLPRRAHLGRPESQGLLRGRPVTFAFLSSSQVPRVPSLTYLFREDVFGAGSRAGTVGGDQGCRPQVGQHGHSSVEDATTAMELYRLVEAQWERRQAGSLPPRPEDRDPDSSTDVEQYMEDQYWPEDLAQGTCGATGEPQDRRE